MFEQIVWDRERLQPSKSRALFESGFRLEGLLEALKPLSLQNPTKAVLELRAV